MATEAAKADNGPEDELARCAATIAELWAEVEGLHLRGSYDLAAVEGERDELRTEVGRLQAIVSRVSTHEADLASRLRAVEALADEWFNDFHPAHVFGADLRAALSAPPADK